MVTDSVSLRQGIFIHNLYQFHVVFRKNRTQLHTIVGGRCGVRHKDNKRLYIMNHYFGSDKIYHLSEIKVNLSYITKI